LVVVAPPEHQVLTQILGAPLVLNYLARIEHALQVDSLVVMAAMGDRWHLEQAEETAVMVRQTALAALAGTLVMAATVQTTPTELRALAVVVVVAQARAL
jgi:hypothetical protein